MRGFLTLFGAFLVATLVAFGVSATDAPDAEAAPYSQIVDNTTEGRFKAPGWNTSAYSPTRYGKNYHFAEPDMNGKPARYKVEIPSKGSYTVFARWASNGGYNPKVRYGVATTQGMKWKVVDQRSNGGKWMKLGVHDMEAGDRFSVQVSRATKADGYVIADAIQVVKGNVESPSGGGSTGGGSTGGGGSGGGTTGADVIKEARGWLGVPYRYGGTTKQGVDCSGLSYAVYRKLGKNLQRTASAQYSSAPGTKVAKSSRARGFLIFGNTGNQSGIQHVGILVGNGDMIHAPYPGTVVRQENVGGWYNVIGVKRIFPA